jgi:hypothetical protein
MGVIAINNRAVLYKVEGQHTFKHYREIPCYEVYQIDKYGRWTWQEDENGKCYTSLKEAKAKFLLESI